jgi:Zn-dependent protease
MASSLQALLAYLAAWFTVTALLSIMLRGRRNERFKVNPLILLVRAEQRFERFEKLRRYKVIGYILDAGFITLLGAAAWFYYIIAKRLYIMLVGVHAQPILVPVIPGITISIETFVYLLPGLSLGIILHELMHALAARYEGIRVRFVGFFIVLGVLPAAFVEPEEEDLKRARLRGKLRVYSAGVLANIVLALISLGLLQAYNVGSSYIYLTKVVEGSPADKAGLKPGVLITDVNINGTDCGGFTGFIRCMTSLSEEYGGTSNITLLVTFHLANGSTIELLKPRGEKMVGIAFVAVPPNLLKLGLNPKTAYAVYVMTELSLAVNMGLAFINAIPLFISDGAQAIRSIVARFAGEEKAAIIVSTVSTITLLLLLPNIYIP